MTRLVSTLRHDVLNQYREGFYFASVIVLITVGAVISFLPPGAAVVVPAILLTNMLVATFVFLAALLLLEKGQGTLEGLIVTPLRSSEYLLAKVLSLTLLAVVENAAITSVALMNGLLTEVNWGWVLVGSAFSGSVYTLLGFLTVIRYQSLSDFMMPMVLVTALLELPAMICFGMPEYLALYLLPTHGPLLMFQSALEPVPAMPAWKLVYAVVYPSAWILASFFGGRRAFHKFITVGIGKS